MEQQKILWIIFSVALFILVVVGVGVIWFLPSNHNTVAQATTTKSGNQAKISFDPYEWAKSQNSNYPGLENPPAGQGQAAGQGSGNFTIIYGQQQGETQSGGASKQPTVTVSPQSSGSTSKATQTLPAPKAAAPAPRRTATASAPAPRPAKSVAPSRPATVRVVQHWIQVASYTSDFRAEQAKKALETNGITGKVMSRDINGRTYFRVRVGPYLNQSEAEKFLGEIKKISEFRNSYISLVYASQRVN